MKQLKIIISYKVLINQFHNSNSKRKKLNIDLIDFKNRKFKKKET